MQDCDTVRVLYKKLPLQTKKAPKSHMGVNAVVCAPVTAFILHWKHWKQNCTAWKHAVEFLVNCGQLFI